MPNTDLAQPLQPGQRYHCSHCANLTRFTVIVERRISYYHHQEVGLDGKMTPEEEEVLSEVVVEVSCRWCGNGNHVEIIGPENGGEAP